MSVKGDRILPGTAFVHRYCFPYEALVAFIVAVEPNRLQGWSTARWMYVSSTTITLRSKMVRDAAHERFLFSENIWQRL